MKTWYSVAKQPLDLWIEDLNTVESLSALGDKSSIIGTCQLTEKDQNSVAAASEAPDPKIRMDLQHAFSESALATAACYNGTLNQAGSYADRASTDATAAQTRAESLS